MLCDCGSCARRHPYILNHPLDSFRRNGLSSKEGDTYMPGIRMPINLTLKRGIIKKDDDNQTVQYLYNWIESINLNETELRDVIISLCDKEGRPSISWQVMGAFPVNLEIPTFDSYDDGIAIESMELMAHTIKMTHP